MERRILIFIIIGFGFLTVSCKNPGMYVRIFSGNYAYSRGDYQDANLMYIKAASSGAYSDYVSYNLGNVYYALGEASSALDKWKKSIKSKDSRVVFSSSFNRGVQLYELSRYEEAFVYFKKSLEIKPSDVSSKINLEYCLLKMNIRDNGSGKIIRKNKTENKNKKSDATRILDFVKRVERKSFSPKKGTGIPGKGEINDW